MSNPSGVPTLSLSTFPQDDAVVVQCKGKLIAEWKSPDFQSQPMQELVLLVALYLALSRGLKLPLFRLLVVIGLVHLFLRYARIVKPKIGEIRRRVAGRAVSRVLRTIRGVIRHAQKYFQPRKLRRAKLKRLRVILKLPHTPVHKYGITHSAHQRQ